MIKDLDINPKNWVKSDVERVIDLCRKNGGKAVLFPPQGDGESDTFAELTPDGVLSVWFKKFEMAHVWTFRIL